jgi:hypothetical protein
MGTMAALAVAAALEGLTFEANGRAESHEYAVT